RSQPHPRPPRPNGSAWDLKLRDALNPVISHAYLRWPGMEPNWLRKQENKEYFALSLSLERHYPAKHMSSMVQFLESARNNLTLGPVDLFLTNSFRIESCSRARLASRELK